MPCLHVGLVGFGTVGTGVARIVLEQRDAIRARTGLDITLSLVCDKDTTSDRGVSLPAGMLSSDLEALWAAEDIGVVVELVGGTGFAKELVLRAIERGKHVVTANKALLALHGSELFTAASRAGVSLSFEASVCGGIPLIRAVRDGYAGNEIRQMMGIVNGTCNYILTQMARTGTSYQAALEEAQAKGFAEADPTLDVGGGDSAHKIAILARMAFAREIAFDAVSIEGIDHILPMDIQFGSTMGYVLKLLAVAKLVDGQIDLRVHPAFLPARHPLAAVNNEFNAVWVRGEATGDTMHYGRGAGQMPTAAAVVSDLIDVGLGRAAINATSYAALSGDLPPARIRPIAEIDTHYYLRFSVVDRPGVLSAITGVLGQHQISIASAVQPEQNPEGDVPIVMVTHEAREHQMVSALKTIDAMDSVTQKTQLIRIEK
jgi:homoserine dehydrogenase